MCRSLERAPPLWHACLQAAAQHSHTAPIRPTLLASFPASFPACLPAQGGSSVSSMLVNQTVFSDPDSWFQYPNQKSAPVTLAAGQPILLEGSHMNGPLNGNLMVGIWATAGRVHGVCEEGGSGARLPV